VAWYKSPTDVGHFCEICGRLLIVHRAELRFNRQTGTETFWITIGCPRPAWYDFLLGVGYTHTRESASKAVRFDGVHRPTASGHWYPDRSSLFPTATVPAAETSG
jgi:hypothetical protein